MGIFKGALEKKGLLGLPLISSDTTFLMVSSMQFRSYALSVPFIHSNSFHIICPINLACKQQVIKFCYLCLTQCSCLKMLEIWSIGLKPELDPGHRDPVSSV